MTSGDGRREKRVAELLRAHLAEALRRELADPLFAQVVITRVEVTRDLMLARVGVRSLSDDGDALRRRELVRHLRRGAGRLCRAIAPRLDLKRAPELRFDYDEASDAVTRVETLLQEIESERRSREPGD